MSAKLWKNQRTAQEQVDKARLNPESVCKILVQFIQAVSNGTLPPNLNEAQVKTWIKDHI